MKTARSEDKLLAVVGSPRSGSTAMLQAIRRTSGLPTIVEPDNPAMAEWRTDRDREICAPILSRSLSSGVFGLAKHLVSQGIGLAKFMISADMPVHLKLSNFLLLVNCGPVSRVVVTYRESVFKQALSLSISLKTRLWHDDPEAFRHAEIGKLSPEVFGQNLLMLRSYNNFVLSMGHHVPNGDKLFVCKYEDFFDDQGNQDLLWESLFQFLGYNYAPDILVNVNSRRYNGPHTYSKIDNLSELKDIYSEFVAADAAYLRELTKLPQPCGELLGDIADKLPSK